MSSRVSHPILRLEVVGPNGVAATDHRVFCRLQRRAVQVETCCGCVHCDAITDGEAPTVDCTIPLDPLTPSEDVSGERTEVGTLLCRGTVVVAQSASVASALRILRTEDRRSVAIVDERNALVGLVHEAGFMSYRSCRRDEAVSVAMSTAIALDERTPVRTALRLLAANHLREATVVSSDGVPLGVFRDVDGLRWIASAQRG